MSLNLVITSMGQEKITIPDGIRTSRSFLPQNRTLPTLLIQVDRTRVTYKPCIPIEQFSIECRKNQNQSNHNGQSEQR